MEKDAQFICTKKGDKITIEVDGNGEDIVTLIAHLIVSLSKKANVSEDCFISAIRQHIAVVKMTNSSNPKDAVAEFLRDILSK